MTLAEELVALAVSGVLILAFASVIANGSAGSRQLARESGLSKDWLALVQKMNGFVGRAGLSQTSTLKLSDCASGACRTLRLAAAGDSYLEIRAECVEGSAPPGPPPAGVACLPARCGPGRVPALAVVMKDDARLLRRRYPNNEKGAAAALCMRRTSASEIALELVLQTGEGPSAILRRAGALILPRRPTL